MKWTSDRDCCELCQKDISKLSFVDGKTRMGPWGIMCLECHKKYGVGLGLGKGQQYDASGVRVAG